MTHRFPPLSRLSRRLLATALLGVGLNGLPPAPAQAETAQAAWQDRRHDFAIAAGPLPRALGEFSRITGLSLVYTDEAPYQVRSAALQGNLSAAAALERLLAGSGYTYRQLDERTLTLQRLASDGALMNLPSTLISGTGGTPDSYQPEPVASIMRSDTPVLEIPQTINVVAAQVVKDQRPRNLDDALNNISGITQANTLGGTQDAVTKRGFGDNRDGSIMRDGIPSILGRNFTASVDHVEVLKGPASLLYGIQDPGGVVNLVSKKPELVSRHAVSASTSSYAHGRNGSGGQFDSTGALGDSGLAYRLIVDYEDEDYWRNFGTNRETVIAPSLAWYGADTTVLLSYEHREYSYPFDRGTAIDPGTGRPLDISRRRRLDEEFNITDGRSDLTRFSIDHDFDEHWKGHFAYGWTRETYDDNQARATAVDTSSKTVTRRVDGTHGAVSTNSFARLGLNGDFELFGLRHELMTGIDSEKRKIFRADLIRGATSTISYSNPVYGQVGASDNVDAASSDQTDKLRTDSAYIQDSIHLNERWILVLGTRYQRYDQWAGRGRPFQANTDVQDHEWTPRAGLVYKVSDEVSLYGSYTYSFKPNSTIAPLGNNQNLQTPQILDGSVAPEEARSWEIGGKLDIPGRITANLALFDIHKRNVLVSQLDASGDSYSRAAGKVRSYGLELDVSGQLGERWSLIGSYAWLHAEVTDDPELEDNHLQNVAKTTASASLVYDAGSLFGGDQLRLGGGTRYVGKRSGDSANSFTLPAYTVTDLFATYDTRIGEHKLGLQFNVKNLFDKTYYSSSANQYYVSLGEARQFQLSTTLEF
ncbi:TonB-dependent siderophore receptor [Azotobacter vinelandii]|uniref:TonB-dependent siderophore receptor n=1 Tax=Azotobacter vinelandii TaxID=354 RepID=UPI000774715C|nr:TonB-dependent siderophore receptor [Azotobacter vinelandii]